MKNFVQPGENLTIPAPADVSSGGVVIAGKILGIACGDALNGVSVDVATTGIFDVPKVAEDAFTLGGDVYWNTSSKLATTTSGGNTRLGVAVAAAGASTATVRCRLSGF